jgi:capsular polysaccharide biosynthesis protein
VSAVGGSGTRCGTPSTTTTERKTGSTFRAGTPRDEDEVVEMLRGYGFESYALEELSVATQVELFANAELVVAPHGAGLANVLYADDVAIVELFGESKKTTFYRLAKLLDHDYRLTTNAERHTDIVVDVPGLEREVRRVLAERSGRR